MKLSFEQLEQVAGLFHAFAEPTRLAILQELKAGEASVSDIVNALTTSQANVSKQLNQLYNAGVVTRRKQGTQVLYVIADEMVFELCSLVCDKLNRDASRPAKLRFWGTIIRRRCGRSLPVHQRQPESGQRHSCDDVDRAVVAAGVFCPRANQALDA